MCSGQKLNAEDVFAAQEMFAELLTECSEFQGQKGEPCASVGDFIRKEVCFFELLENYTGNISATSVYLICIASHHP